MCVCVCVCVCVYVCLYVCVSVCVVELVIGVSDGVRLLTKLSFKRDWYAKEKYLCYLISDLHIKLVVAVVGFCWKCMFQQIFRIELHLEIIL